MHNDRKEEEDDRYPYLYEVEIPDDNGHNYLYWNGILTDKELENIANKLPSEQ